MNFDTHYVAFIDLLGFSEMVRHDSETSEENVKFFPKLYDVFKRTKALSTDGRFDIVQFSDSITISAKYDRNLFNDLISLIANLQFELFRSGILIRGGLSLGKHFYKDGFLFSQGLINAYQLENRIAKFPRVVISLDLLSLIFPEFLLDQSVAILKENDEVYFIDYLMSRAKTQCEESYNSIISMNGNAKSPSVLDKYNWIKEYIKFKFPDSALQSSRFFNPDLNLDVVTDNEDSRAVETSSTPSI